MTELDPAVTAQMASDCREPLVVLTMSEYERLRKQSFLRSFEKKRMEDWTDEDIRRVLDYARKS